jgi:hypothetical protein
VSLKLVFGFLLQIIPILCRFLMCPKNSELMNTVYNICP